MTTPAHPKGEAALWGRKVIVTGASGTVGRALVERFTRAGARVIGLDLHEAAIPVELLPASPSAPSQLQRSTVDGSVVLVPVMACDLTNAAQLPDRVDEAVDRLGGLNLLINNAGVDGPAPAELAPDATVRRQLEVNLLAAWATTAAAMPTLETMRGRVIFIASQTATLPQPLAAAYGVSKRALVAYADALRLEVGSHVGVSVVYPSLIASPIHNSTAAAGLPLDDASRFESLEGVVKAVVRAATATRAPAHIATSWRGRVELALARHLPYVAEMLVRRTMTARLADGALANAPLAAGMRRRAGLP